MVTLNLGNAHQVADEYFHPANFTSHLFTHNVGKINEDTYEITCQLCFNKADNIDTKKGIKFLNELLREFSLNTVGWSNFKQNLWVLGTAGQNTTSNWQSRAKLRRSKDFFFVGCNFSLVIGNYLSCFKSTLSTNSIRNTVFLSKKEFKLYVFSKRRIDVLDELCVLNILFKKHKLTNLGWSNLEVCKEPFKSFYLDSVYTFRSRKETQEKETCLLKNSTYAMNFSNGWI